MGFWEERWSAGQIGFHEGKPNELLERHVARLGERRRVLVPLCGKTEDLAYLAARGHQVVGVELVDDAARQFFDEHPGIEGVQIIVRDFFAVTAADVGAIDAFYDRAALVALPAELRPRYVEHLRRLVAPGSPGLAIPLEYDQTIAPGPPFSVSEAELRALWAGATMELLDERPGSTPRLREAGATLVERCFAIVAA